MNNPDNGKYYDPSYGLIYKDAQDFEAQAIAFYGWFQPNPKGFNIRKKGSQGSWRFNRPLAAGDTAMRSRVTLATLLMFSVSGSAAMPPLVGADESIVRGAIYENRVYAMRKEKETPKEGDKLWLLRAPLATAETQEPILVWYSIREPIQWRLDRDQLWINARDWSPDRTALLTDRVFRFDFSELSKGVRRTGRTPNYSNDVAESIVAGYGPVQSLGVLAALAKIRVKVYYDYIPISTESLQLYVLSNTNARLIKNADGKDTIEGDLDKEAWTFRRLKYEATWGPNPVDRRYKTWIAGTWTEEAPLEVAFKEEFHAYAARGDTCYFVTESGKLFHAASKQKVAQRTKVVPAWEDARRPITHVITDVDRKRTVAFGKNREDPKQDVRFAFELTGEKEVKVVYLAATVLKQNKLEEPLKSVVEYAQYHRDQEQAREESALLMMDKRLQAIVPLENRPELRDLLERLTKLTGLKFTVDHNLRDHRPVSTFGAAMRRSMMSCGSLLKCN